MHRLAATVCLTYPELNPLIRLFTRTSVSISKSGLCVARCSCGAAEWRLLEVAVSAPVWRETTESLRCHRRGVDVCDWSTTHSRTRPWVLQGMNWLG